jgi:hypothetical protein
MNLKIDDLEKNDGGKKGTESAPDKLSETSKYLETSVSKLSIESQNLIQQSMKEALLHMMNSSGKQTKKQPEPPKVYEKIIQKLEADIRGHIRLEHEMKIHMDYLEAKIEKFEKEHKFNEDTLNVMNKKVHSL